MRRLHLWNAMPDRQLPHFVRRLIWRDQRDLHLVQLDLDLPSILQAGKSDGAGKGLGVYVLRSNGVRDAGYVRAVWARDAILHGHVQSARLRRHLR